MRAYKVAKSGEVFYIKNGMLETASTMAEYEAMVNREQELNSTYFTFTVGRTTYKHLVTRWELIRNIIRSNTNSDQMLEQMSAYIKLCNTVNLQESERI